MTDSALHEYLTSYICTLTYTREEHLEEWIIVSREVPDCPFTPIRLCRLYLRANLFGARLTLGKRSKRDARIASRYERTRSSIGVLEERLFELPSQISRVPSSTSNQKKKKETRRGPPNQQNCNIPGYKMSRSLQSFTRTMNKSRGIQESRNCKEVSSLRRL